MEASRNALFGRHRFLCKVFGIGTERAPLGHQQATDMPVRKRLTSNVSKGGWAHERECRNGSLEPTAAVLRGGRR